MKQIYSLKSKAGKDSVDLTTKKSFKDWFTTPLFYKLGVTWMATMVFTNMSQVYMPLYIQTTLRYSETFL